MIVIVVACTNRLWIVEFVFGLKREKVEKMSNQKSKEIVVSNFGIEEFKTLISEISIFQAKLIRANAQMPQL